MNDSLSKRHPLESLGLVQATRGEIRAERLERRLIPRVPFPHRHDFYQIVVIRKGRGWHQIDFQRHLVRPNQVFIIKPGQMHGWEFGSAIHGYIIEFTTESLAEGRGVSDSPIHARLSSLADVVQSPEKTNSKMTAPKIFEHCELMCSEFDNRNDARESALQSLLNLVLIALYRLDKTASRVFHDEDRVIENFERLVEDHFRVEHRVEFYAKLLKLSPRALTMRLKRSLDRSARDLIQDRCLLEARRLLAYSAQPIHNISDLLGFQDPNYFSRIFKSKTRQTPAQFRTRAASKI